MPSWESELLVLLSDFSAYLDMAQGGTRNYEAARIDKSMKFLHMYHRRHSDLKLTGVQDGCQHELVCHSSVSATVGLGKCRTRLGVWAIGKVDVD